MIHSVSLHTEYCDLEPIARKRERTYTIQGKRYG